MLCCSIVLLRTQTVSRSCCTWWQRNDPIGQIDQLLHLQLKVLLHRPKNASRLYRKIYTLHCSDTHVDCCMISVWLSQGLLSWPQNVSYRRQIYAYHIPWMWIKNVNFNSTRVYQSHNMFYYLVENQDPQHYLNIEGAELNVMHCLLLYYFFTARCTSA